MKRSVKPKTAKANAARRSAADAPRRSSLPKVLFMSPVRRRPSTALTFSKPARPIESRHVRF